MALSPTLLQRIPSDLAPKYGARSGRERDKNARRARSEEFTAKDHATPATEIECKKPTKSVQLESPLNTFSDLELLIAFREGNERAFAEFYARHKTVIYTYCLRMMGGDEQRASDTFQEVFIKVFEKASQFREGTNVMGWLFMITRNMCLNVFRTARPTEALGLHPMLESKDRSLAPEYDEEQHFLREKLEESISKLPVEFREPFILREFDGFSYSEIAELTGTTLSMTKVRIYRAKQQMRVLLRPFV